MSYRVTYEVDIYEVDIYEVGRWKLTADNRKSYYNSG